jgi:ComF family protein
MFLAIFSVQRRRKNDGRNAWPMKATLPLNSAVTRLANEFVDLLFPPVCGACGKLGPLICAGCWAQLQTIEQPYCLRCGRPTSQSMTSCPACATKRFALQQSRACYSYREPLVTIIHRLKYEGLFALAKPLGAEMARSWPDWRESPNLIVPIPLHPRRQRARGFNQSHLLAQSLGSFTGLEVRADALRRVRHTKPQVGLNPAQRTVNVIGAFAAAVPAVRDKHILLVDDVYTTGATMFAAAASLCEAGARSVSAYCLARAVQ